MRIAGAAFLIAAALGGIGCRRGSPGYGLDIEVLHRGPLATSSTAAALADRTIDAAFVTGYYPSSVAHAATSALHKGAAQYYRERELSR